jgi:hypothetical protein
VPQQQPVQRRLVTRARTPYQLLVGRLLGNHVTFNEPRRRR